MYLSVFISNILKRSKKCKQFFIKFLLKKKHLVVYCKMFNEIAITHELMKFVYE